MIDLPNNFNKKYIIHRARRFCLIVLFPSVGQDPFGFYWNNQKVVRFIKIFSDRYQNIWALDRTKSLWMKLIQASLVDLKQLDAPKSHWPQLIVRPIVQSLVHAFWDWLNQAPIHYPKVHAITTTTKHNR